MSSALALTFFALITVSTGVAPGDEHHLCQNMRKSGEFQTITYSVNMRVLMDSWNYESLLNHSNGDPVWDKVNNDAVYSSAVSLIINM